MTAFVKKLNFTLKFDRFWLAKRSLYGEQYIEHDKKFDSDREKSSDLVVQKSYIHLSLRSSSRCYRKLHHCDMPRKVKINIENVKFHR